MAVERVKIVLDADVIIHFSKGGLLSLLPQIFPEYDYIVLDKVYDELTAVRNHLDNQILYFKNIRKVVFAPTSEMVREYANLKTSFGDGESACMTYCRFTSNIIGSSNLRDIKNYCADHGITYLTTLDFLYYAWYRMLLTDQECIAFIYDVTSKGSRLPMIQSITQYRPNVML